MVSEKELSGKLPPYIQAAKAQLSGCSQRFHRELFVFIPLGSMWQKLLPCKVPGSLLKLELHDEDSQDSKYERSRVRTGSKAGPCFAVSC